jgi:hypothetical protein
MKLNQPKNQRVHVTVLDPTAKRRKSQTVTLYGKTKAEVIDLLRQAITNDTVAPTAPSGNGQSE